jgi:hypothetical protein
MKKTYSAAMDPLIEGYLSYLDKVGRKTPRTIIDVRCTLRRATTHFAPDQLTARDVLASRIGRSYGVERC